MGDLIRANSRRDTKNEFLPLRERFMRFGDVVNPVFSVVAQVSTNQSNFTNWQSIKLGIVYRACFTGPVWDRDKG